MRTSHTRRSLTCLLFLTLLTPVMAAVPSSAGMKAMGDIELAGISGQMGLSLHVKNLSFSLRADSVKYTDTDTGSALEFLDLRVHDGSGGPFYFDSNEDPVTFDCLTVDDPDSPADGTSLVMVKFPNWTQDVYVSAKHLIFCGQELGPDADGLDALGIGKIDTPYSCWLLAGHGVGISWEHGFETHIAEVVYTYNNTPASLSVKDVYFSKTAAGDPDKPDSWTFDGPFTIGDIISDDPATMDVATRTDNNKSFILLNLPANGCLRVEDVNFDGQDFGPCAIDGITVHHLQVQIPGNL